MPKTFPQSWRLDWSMGEMTARNSGALKWDIEIVYNKLTFTSVNELTFETLSDVSVIKSRGLEKGYPASNILDFCNKTGNNIEPKEKDSKDKCVSMCNRISVLAKNQSLSQDLYHYNMIKIWREAANG